MEFIRVKHAIDWAKYGDDILGLLYGYVARINHQLSAKELLEQWVRFTATIDHMVFIFWDEEQIRGFVFCSMLGNSQRAYLYVDEFYCPYKGLEAWRHIKAITRVFGLTEIWGRAEEKIYRTCRKHLKDAELTKEQIVRIKLWAAEANQKANQDH